MINYRLKFGYKNYKIIPAIAFFYFYFSRIMLFVIKKTLIFGPEKLVGQLFLEKIKIVLKRT